MLVGKYNHTVDAKNRIFIPVKIKEKLGSSFIITYNVDKCLSLYSEKEWEAYTARFNELPKTQTRNIIRFIFSNASEVVPDSQGRVILSQEFMDYAQIGKNAVIIGVNDHAEIWSEENYNAMYDQEMREDIAAQMIELGL